MTKITSSSALLGGTSTTAITTKQDAVRQQIQNKQAQIRADGAAISAANEAKSTSNAWFNGLSPKDQAKPANIAKHNQALAGADEARSRAEQAAEQHRKELEKLQNQDLPAAIQADQAATQAAQDREKMTEDQARSADQQAKENKKNAEEAARTAEQTGKDTQKKSSADVVGKAVGGAETHEAAASKSEAPAAAEGSAPAQAEGDGYQAPQNQAASRGYAPGNSMLPGAAEEQEETRPTRQDGATSQPGRPEGQGAAKKSATVVTGDKGTVVVPQGTDAPTTSSISAQSPKVAVKLDENGKPIVAPPAVAGGAQASKASAPATAPLTLESLTDEQRAHVVKTFHEVKEAAKSGDVKKTEDAFIRNFVLDGMDESGTADSNDGAGKKTGNKKQSSATVGGAANKEVTAAGSEGLSVQAGATGLTTNAAQRGQVAGLTPKNTLGGAGKTVGAAPGKTDAVGAAPSGYGASVDYALKPVSEIQRGYVGGMSPMELVQLVMLTAFEEAGKSVESVAKMMQKQTEAKGGARMEQNRLRELISYNSVGAMDTQSRSYSNQLESISGTMDSIGDDNQIAMIRLQSATQNLTTMSQAASNLSKNLYDTVKSVIGQIGH